MADILFYVYIIEGYNIRRGNKVVESQEKKYNNLHSLYQRITIIPHLSIFHVNVNKTFWLTRISDGHNYKKNLQVYWQMLQSLY